MTPVEYALAYARLGWRVFPVHSVRTIKDKLWCTCSDANCNHQGKHPIAKLVPKGRNDATTDIKTISQWWRVFPSANVGIATGKESGVVVIDVDSGPGKVGAETLETLEAKNGKMPDTALSLTGSGGMHFLFSYPGDAVKVKSASDILGKHIDSRGDGGYIVAPPSKHISGGEYIWEASSDPTEGVELAELPSWIRQMLEAKKEEPAIDGNERLSDIEVSKVRSALAYINPDDRDVWVEVGMALQSTGAGEQAYGLWCEWSQGSDKYNAADQRRVWASFKAGGITKATIFGIAQKAGWLNVDKKVVNGPNVVHMDKHRKKEAKGDSDEKPTWTKMLSRTDKGIIHCSIANVTKILQNDTRWKGVLAFDEFSLKGVKIKNPPFPRGTTGLWGGSDDSRTAIWLSDHYHFRPSTKVVAEAIPVVAEEKTFHPVRAYLDSLKWDETQRVRTWLIKYLGSPDTPSARLMGTCWLIGAVARIMQPGCKMDNVLMIEGEQGLGKSKAMEILGGQWFSDTPFEIGSKDGYLMLIGHWIIELSELDSFNRAESTRAKQFFAARKDTYRELWAGRPADVPRQCVFVGTTNAEEYLKDESGNRRYWPVLATKINESALRRDRDQLWAEAYELYKQGEQWWIDPHLDYVKAEQEKRFSVDAWESKIQSYIDSQQRDYSYQHPAPPFPFYVTVADILGHCLEIPSGKWTRADQMRVSAILKRVGMVRRKYPDRSSPEKKTEWGYGYRFSKNE